jgi:hypothetical protein
MRKAAGAGSRRLSPLLVDNAEVFIRIATAKSVGYNPEATEKKDALCDRRQ